MPPAAVRETGWGRAGPVIALLLMVTGLTGCVTSGSGPGGERALHPSSLEVVGHVVWVDRAENTAVIQLRRGVSLSLQPLIARNEAMVETARLQATETRQGRTLGMRIVEGLPNAGDEVVLLRDRN